jgi:hypothetical protein
MPSVFSLVQGIKKILMIPKYYDTSKTMNVIIQTKKEFIVASQNIFQKELSLQYA